MKIAVYAIALNEEKFIERFCESAKEADYIIIADTGSTDNTKFLAEQAGATVHSIAVIPWRFDKARDAALSLVPNDAEACISLDIDEVLEPGWRQEVEKVWRRGTTRLKYLYHWGPGVEFHYEKIHHRQGYFWHHPCHEYPKPDPRLTEVWATTDALLVRHLPDYTKPRSQYLELLEMSVKEDPSCPRNAFYYARELTYKLMWEEAKSALVTFLDHPGATWINERSMAMILLGKSYYNTGDQFTGLQWLRKACAEAPHTREPWVELAQIAHDHSMWLECYHAITTALAITEKELVYTSDASAWGEKPHDLASIAAWNLGFHDKAYYHCLTAHALAPNNKRIKDNVDLFRENRD